MFPNGIWMNLSSIFPIEMDAGEKDMYIIQILFKYLNHKYPFVF